MRPSLRETLGSTPVVLEIVPPARRATPKAVDAFVGRAITALQSVPNIDAVNIPEVLDENHVGQPFYRNLDPRVFAAQLREQVEIEPIVNKVVAHLPSEKALRQWIDESLDEHGLRSFVFVGGTSSRVHYSGPSVLEANRIFRSIVGDRKDVALGNITIPERDHEVDRLIEKTRAGCDFFSTQVLFEAEPMATVVRAYGRRCAAQGLKPATILLSFAPVADYQDIEFLVWLGATVTPRTEEALLASLEKGPEQAAIDFARSLWSHLRPAAALSRPPVPIGVNIEEISMHNLELAVRMAREFPAWSESKERPRPMFK